MDVGDNAKLAREAAGISRETAAGEMGITVQSLANKESGRTQFTAAELAVASRIYNKPIGRLFAGEAKP